MLEIDIFVQIQSFRLCLRITHIVFQVKLLLCVAQSVQIAVHPAKSGIPGPSQVFETLRSKQVVGQIQKVCNYTSTHTRANHAQVVLNQP